MRRDINGLALLVPEGLGRGPFAGDVFMFSCSALGPRPDARTPFFVMAEFAENARTPSRTGGDLIAGVQISFSRSWFG